jgi:hypothetical protein
MNVCSAAMTAAMMSRPLAVRDIGVVPDRLELSLLLWRVGPARAPLLLPSCPRTRTVVIHGVYFAG